MNETHLPRLLEQQLNVILEECNVESWRFNNGSQIVLSIRFVKSDCETQSNISTPYSYRKKSPSTVARDRDRKLSWQNTISTAEIKSICTDDYGIVNMVPNSSITLP